MKKCLGKAYLVILKSGYYFIENIIGLCINNDVTQSINYIIVVNRSKTYSHVHGS